MTHDRFMALCAAYGADIGRWPEAERAAGRDFAAAHAELARASLAAEGGLDSVLADYAIGPSPALRERVIAAAPLARVAERTWRWLTAAGLGLGLAASAAAGVAVGVTLVPPSVERLIGAPAGSNADDVSVLADPADDPAGG